MDNIRGRVASATERLPSRQASVEPRDSRALKGTILKCFCQLVLTNNMRKYFPSHLGSDVRRVMHGIDFVVAGRFYMFTPLRTGAELAFQCG